MNFFERQAEARRHSRRLVLLFALAVVAIVIAVDVAVVVAHLALGGAGLELPPMLVLATLATLAIIGLGSLYRIASLRGGGETVALELGGVVVPEDTTDFNLRRLRNVVEEIAIASGVPMPKLFVLEHEAGINAFAAGYAPSDAVVAVTRGALERLNRDELQGVVAHEFSHILNGDMRLNVRLMGVLFGILALALVGRKVLEHGRFGRRGKGAAVVLAAALVAMAIGYAGLFFARLIKAGVSRSRERLADASAVQFTRQTAGLAGALKKIGGLHEGSRFNDRSRAEEVSHLLFGDGVGLAGWFATHPPLLERIQALEPGFTGDRLAYLARQWLDAPPNGIDEDVQRGFATRRAEPLPVAGADATLRPAEVVGHVAHPGPADYRRAGAIVDHLPDALRALARQRDAVVPLLLALLMDARADVQERQVFEVAARLGKVVAEEARHLHALHIAGLHPMQRLPLASLAFPVLRLRPRPELDVFLDAANAVTFADGAVSLFEYCLGRLLTVHVRESLDPQQYARFGRRKPSDVRAEIATLLAAVAQAGHEDDEQARRAYVAGMHKVLPRDAIAYRRRPDLLQALDEVWMPLDALDPLAKQPLVEGLVAAIGHDGRASVAEVELLRTICAVLHCPLPPLATHGAR